MNEIQIFNNPDFGEIRTLMIEGEPWFVLADICKILEISNSRMVAGRLEPDELMSVRLTSGGQHREMTAVSESGLYAVVLRSAKPQAKPFRKWVTSEVLPTIRKTGGYVSDDELFVNTYLPYADTATKELFKLNLTTIRQLNKKIKHDKPLVDFARHVNKTDDLIDMQAFAKIVKNERINVGRNKMFDWFRENKYLISKGIHKNEPYQRYIEQGLFVVKEQCFENSYCTHVYNKTYITGKGQIYFVVKLRKEFGTTEGK